MYLSLAQEGLIPNPLYSFCIKCEVSEMQCIDIMKLEVGPWLLCLFSQLLWEGNLMLLKKLWYVEHPVRK